MIQVSKDKKHLPKVTVLVQTGHDKWPKMSSTCLKVWHYMAKKKREKK